ncbi:hypothetical protein GCM10010331_23950 [Streptomyces xanthochromogenes]|uniref:hypothetical protein n=1 Tax=Streptomyces TaxID=1883 RepID=UPI00136A5A8E|nr:MULTISPECIES: hypothetical protein [Streptomyces]MYV89815.1 hypothetical protein [Streptomyces sp. SID1034]GHB35768.1 hypothetical protein GCM10010331_23950 [Streptomyces xanthochromogenes]
MNSSEISHPPIYQRLISERGDVLAETRTVAEQAQHEAREALDWSGVRRAHLRDDDSFSAFG